MADPLNFPRGPEPVHKIIITDQIKERFAREPNYKLESEVLRDLSKKLGESPEVALKALVEHALRICDAESAGVSIAETENGSPIFRWHAVAGKLSPFLYGTMPGDFSPCGEVINRRSTLLMKDMIKHYAYVEGLGMPINEVLLVPFFQKGEPVGTVWVVSHSEKKFNAEDRRILESIAEFTSTIAQSYLDFKRMKEKEIVLEKSEKQMASALTTSKIGFFDWDMVEDRIFFNERMQFDWGIQAGSSLEEVINYIHEDDRDETFSMIDTAVKNHLPYKHEYRVVRPDGQTVWIEAQGAVYYDSEGKPLRFIGTSLDITDSKSVERKLMLSNQQFDLVLSNLSVLVSYIDKTETYKFVNEAYGTWFHTDIQSIVGKTLREFVGEFAYEIVKTNVSKALNGEKVEFESEISYPIGKRFVHVTYTPDVDKQTGSTLGIIVLIQDQSQQKANSRILENEREKLKTMIEKAPIAVALMKGPTHEFEIINDEWGKLVSARSYLGRNHADVYFEVGNDSRMADALKHVFETGETFHTEEMKLNIETSPGLLEDQYYDFSYTRVLDAEGKPYGIFCFTENVSDRVLAKIKDQEYAGTLSSAVNELTSEREIREKFVNTLSHDLRTPLTSARLSAQLLLKKSEPNNETTKLGRRIVAGLDRTERMVKNLLDANLIKAGQGIPVFFDSCNLSAIAKNVVEDYTVLNGPYFKLDSSTKDLVGYWDGDALRRVLENLVGNAIKYGTPKSPITIKLEDKTDFIELCVHNEGEVIASKDLITLFDTYTRTDSARGSGQKGWGIGLTLVKGIIESHRGSVGVESTVEGGTSFSIKLPFDSRADL